MEIKQATVFHRGRIAYIPMKQIGKDSWLCYSPNAQTTATFPTSYIEKKLAEEK